MLKAICLTLVAALLLPASVLAVSPSTTPRTESNLKCEDLANEELCEMVQCLLFGCQPGEACEGAPAPTDSYCWLLVCLLTGYCPDAALRVQTLHCEDVLPDFECKLIQCILFERTCPDVMPKTHPAPTHTVSTGLAA